MKPYVLPSLALAAVLATSGAAGCVGSPSRAPGAEAPNISSQAAPRLVGQVAFPVARETAATTGEVIQRATIAILDGANQTVAATVTDASGAFVLDVTGAFSPSPGVTYTVEAIKSLKSATGAGTAVRMRTLLNWSGTAWNSCSGGVSIAISPATTAVALIKATQSSLTYPETMGVVAGSTITTGNGTLSTHGASVRDLVRDLLWRDLDPVARIALSGGRYVALPEQTTLVAANMGTGTYSKTVSLLDGSVQLDGSLPRPKTNSEATASVAGLASTAILASDGVHLYSKPWDLSAANPRTWTRLGSGFGGTTFGANLLSYGASMDYTEGGAFYGGYVYQIKSGAGNSATVWRLNASTLATDSVTFNPPTIARDTGRPNQGHYLATDGTYLYNGAFTINNGGSNGYTLRVYDPATRNMVRQIYLDGANTPFANTSYYTDSIFVDGVYMYTFEWVEAGPARLRRYRLSDGQLEIETTVPNDYPYDGPLGGTYDWVNNKFFFGSHNGTMLHRTAGRTFPTSGTWASTPMDTGASSPVYRRLNFSAVATNGQTVRLQLRSASTEQGLVTAPWLGPTGPGDSYGTSGALVNSAHNGHRWIQVRATLAPALQNAATGLGTTPRLYGVNLEAIR